MAYDGPNPYDVTAGGTGLGSLSAFAILSGGTSSTDAMQQVSGLGTSGQVLTSNGAGALPTWQNVPVSIATINGDTGSVTGSTVTIFANQATLNSGSTVSFLNSGSTSTFNVTDGSSNTIIGSGSGVASSTASSCTGLGQGCLAAITDDDSHVAVGRGALASANDATSNTAIGAFALTTVVGGGGNTAMGDRCGYQLSSGNFNTLYGYFSGQNYTGSESSNLLIQNDGVLGESNVIRIGTQGTGVTQQNQCFIAGIEGASYSAGSPNPALTYCDTSDGQLVATQAVASSSATSTFGSLSVGTALQNTANYAILVNVSIVVNAATSATIVLGIGSTNTPTTNTVVTTFTVAAATTFSFSGFVPAGYFMLVDTTGTIIVGSITTQTCAVG